MFIQATGKMEKRMGRVLISFSKLELSMLDNGQEVQWQMDNGSIPMEPISKVNLITTNLREKVHGNSAMEIKLRENTHKQGERMQMEMILSWLGKQLLT